MPSLEQAYWYGAIFLGLFFTGIGVPPVPEEIMILSAGSMTATKGLQWWYAWPATILGVVCADSTLYAVGRYFGPALFEYRWVQRVVKPERRQRIQKRFEDHGIKILLTARLLPPVRTGVFMIAGAIRYPFLRFLFADLVVALIGVSIFFFGSQALVALLLLAGHWAVYIAGVAIVGFLLFRYYRHLRKRELSGVPQPPMSILQGPAGSAPEGQEKVAPPAEAPVSPPPEPSPSGR